MNTILVPVLALVIWTFVLWFWMYATRIPAMLKARMNMRKIKRPDDLNVLPIKVQQVADNYNHLHEQPTVFYALAFYSQLAGTGDAVNITLAWTYVALRVAHSIIQCTSNYVPVRFMVFSASSLVLMAITLRNVLALL